MSKKQRVFLITILIITLLSGILIGLKATFPIILNTSYPTVGDHINLESLNDLKNPCRTGPSCGNLIAVDCTHGDGDISYGEYYYVERSTETIVSDCKRFCITIKGNFPSLSCPNCPPKEWTCKNN